MDMVSVIDKLVLYIVCEGEEHSGQLESVPSASVTSESQGRTLVGHTH